MRFFEKKGGTSFDSDEAERLLREEIDLSTTAQIPTKTIKKNLGFILCDSEFEHAYVKNSGAFSNARLTALLGLSEKAFKLGANAIVGLDIEVGVTIAASSIISVSGIAVVVE